MGLRPVPREPASKAEEVRTIEIAEPESRIDEPEDEEEVAEAGERREPR